MRKIKKHRIKNSINNIITFNRVVIKSNNNI